MITAIATPMPMIQPMFEFTVSDVRAWLPVSIGGTGGGGGDESTGARAPQSAQSIAYPQVASVEPAEPSLHTPSLAKKQVLVHKYVLGAAGGDADGGGGGEGGNIDTETTVSADASTPSEFELARMS